MSGSFEKSVKGATKIKNAPPKAKYIEHILVATHSGDAGVGEIFRSLQHRVRDSTWTVALKSLLTVHVMIREGAPDVTLAFLAKHRSMLGVTHFSDAQTQGRNIRHYAQYLTERARAYRDTKTDWVRAPASRLERLAVDKGLLRETEAVQHQLAALVKCDILENEPENEITIAIFRLLVLDLLQLFQVLNQGLINILGHFFEMSKTDAERAMEIYRNFTKQTDYTVQFLSSARLHEHHTRVEVPKLKHAPVNLGRQLEEYLNDTDFDIHRRQYLAEQNAKKGGIGSSSSESRNKDFPKPTSSALNTNNPFPTVPESKPVAKLQASKGPDPDLIDFFDSIEQNQTTMQVNPQVNPQQTGMPQFQQPQQTGMPFQSNGFAPQQTGFVSNDMFQQQNQAFMEQQQMQQQHMQQQLMQQQQQQQQQQQPQPLQPNFTGAGFGGYTPQPSFQPGALGSIPQDSMANYQTQGFQQGQEQQQQPMQTGALQAQPTGTNPFRQSMMMQSQPTGMPGNTSPFSPQSPGPNPTLNRQSTNPFARSTQSSSPFQAAAPLQPTPTGTNPFAKNIQPHQQQLVQSTDQQQQLLQGQNPAALAPQATGTTNPFRQGAFVNHSTGLGWQHNQSPIGGGLDNLPTVPVFPRPPQQTPWQQ